MMRAKRKRGGEGSPGCRYARPSAGTACDACHDVGDRQACHTKLGRRDPLRQQASRPRAAVMSQGYTGEKIGRSRRRGGITLEVVKLPEAKRGYCSIAAATGSLNGPLHGPLVAAALSKITSDMPSYLGRRVASATSIASRWWIRSSNRLGLSCWRVAFVGYMSKHAAALVHNTLWTNRRLAKEA